MILFKPERCDFCCRELAWSELRYAYRLGSRSLLYCDRPECRARGKEWRVQRLKKCAEALGLTKSDVILAPIHVPE
jgi:hypothetical protein